MAFIARLSARNAVDPWLRQGGAQAPIRQVDDVDPAQRVKIRTDNVGQTGLEYRSCQGSKFELMVFPVSSSSDGEISMRTQFTTFSIAGTVWLMIACVR